MERVKYPRTPHLPHSPGGTNDDNTITTLHNLQAGEVIATEKMDGEATTIYPDGYSHARSTRNNPHPSRDIIRGLAAGRKGLIPEKPPDLLENLYAKHSIHSNHPNAAIGVIRPTTHRKHPLVLITHDYRRNHYSITGTKALRVRWKMEGLLWKELPGALFQRASRWFDKKINQAGREIHAGR